MPYNKPSGFLCYDNKDIIRDGFISPYLTRIWDGDDFNANKLKKPQKGTTYTVERDASGKITKVYEKRRQLPASRIKLELLFSKVLRNAITHPIDIADLASFGGIGAGSIPGVGMSILPIAFGGITSGTTEFTYHICDTENKINSSITVTKDILLTGIIELPGYPVSVFGVVKEYVELNNKGEEIGRYGLNFSQAQLDVLGNFWAGSYEGAPRMDIRGATDEDGLFHGRYGIRNETDPKDGVTIEQVMKPGQENLFIKIINDVRLLKYRGDNLTANTSKAYPFMSKTTTDITSKKIQIKTDGLREGDTLYITYLSASERRLRQNVRQYGSVLQDNGLDVIVKMMQLNSVNDIFDYKMKRWYVPNTAPSSFNSPDSEFMLSFNHYCSLKIGAPAEIKLAEKTVEQIEGWRMSEVLSPEINQFWAADYRGILLVTKNGTVVVWDILKIRDKQWFYDYLNTLPFLPKHTDAKGNIVIDNYAIKIEDKIDFKKLPECLFDIGEVCNCFVYDKQKIPYYKPFAMALSNCSEYKKDSDLSGIGYPNLDISYNNISKNTNMSDMEAVKKAFAINALKYNIRELEVIDISKSDFIPSQSRPTIYFECEKDFDLYPYHYVCDIYDPADSGGIYFSQSYLEIPFLYKPKEGGFIESFWMLETPYFCGEFTRKSRVIIERIGGNALNNYSMIYANTVPSNPHTISLDNNYYTDSSMLSFWDDIVNTSTSRLRFEDGAIEQGISQIEIDITQSNERKAFDHFEHRVLGYNKILGSVPNYSNGVAVTNAICEICHNKTSGTMQQYNFLTGNTTLDFEDDIPSLNILNDWFIQDITIVYKIKDSALPLLYKEKNQFLSLRFKGTDGVINNISMPLDLKINNRLVINCHYYHGGPLEFYGGLLKHIDVIQCYGTIFTKSILDYAVQSGQTSVVFDKQGRAMIFFADDKSSNISVAMSYDNGDNWEIYSDIIRLIKGETATLPQAFSNNHDEEITLFYVLNDTFLMCKKIDTNWFLQKDLFVTYAPPESYDEKSEDDDDDNSESSLYKYTEQGKALRKETSYFVEGNKEDEYYKKLLKINESIQEKNSEIESNDSGQKQSLRFVSMNSDYQMVKNYNGNAYAVFIDSRGTKRVFFLENNKLTIKSSSNLTMWTYDVVDAEIHKNFFAENQGEIIEIKNIQVVKNAFEEETINFVYFHDGMLFLRIFQSGAIDSGNFQEDGQKDNDIAKKYFDITPSSASNPVFLIGNMPEEIKNKIGEKDEDGNPVLAITVPYNQETIPIFDSRFELDTDTQPFGYYTRKGIIRLFYKDSNGNLNALSISGFFVPMPEVLYRLKRSLV